MPFRYLPDVALADIAFEAEARSPSGLLEECAKAMTDIMVDPKTLRKSVTKEFKVDAPDIDRLLYDFLTELIVLKDVDSLLFADFEVRVDEGGTRLEARAAGEPIDRERHILRNDVKAVTMHMFGVVNDGKKWSAKVVLDI